MPRLLGLSPQHAQQAVSEPSSTWGDPDRAPPAPAPRTLNTVGSKESAGSSFFGRAAFSSKETAKESLGSFRSRASTSSKERKGTREGFSSKDSLGSFKQRAGRGREEFGTKDSTGSASARGIQRRTSTNESTGSMSSSRRSRALRRMRGSKEKEGGGGGFRKGTNRSSRSASSGRSPSNMSDDPMDPTSNDELSSDSEDMEDIDGIPKNRRHLVPLHRLESVILKPKDLDIKAQAPEPVASPLKESARLGSSETLLLKANKPGLAHPPAPSARVICGACWLVAQVMFSVIWLVTAFTLLALHVFKIWETQESTQLLVADAALRGLEVNASRLLSPAVSLVRAVALAGQAGFFELEEPFEALATAAAPELRDSPRLRQLQVLGLNPSRMLQMLPGRLHDKQVLVHKRQPLVYATPTRPCRSGADVMACFGLETEGIALYNNAADAAALNWRGPSMLSFGPLGIELPPEQWSLALHLVASANITGNPDTGVSTNVLLDVAIELAELFEACENAAPKNGLAFIATTDGKLVAASGDAVSPGPIFKEVVTLEEDSEDAETAETAETTETTPELPTIWDLSEDWVKTLPLETLQMDGRVEMPVGPDLAVIRPLELGALSGRGTLAASSTEALRIGVRIPADEAMRPLLLQFEYGGMIVLATPLVTAAVLVILYCLFRALRAFVRYLS